MWLSRNWELVAKNYTGAWTIGTLSGNLTSNKVSSIRLGFYSDGSEVGLVLSRHVGKFIFSIVSWKLKFPWWFIGSCFSPHVLWSSYLEHSIIYFLVLVGLGHLPRSFSDYTYSFGEPFVSHEFSHLRESSCIFALVVNSLLPHNFRKCTSNSDARIGACAVRMMSSVVPSGDMTQRERNWKN